MKTKTVSHTPWQNVSTFDGLTVRVVAPVNFSGDPESRDVVNIASVNPGLPEWKANARLIAASPTLHEFVVAAARGGDIKAKSTLDSLGLPY